MEYDKLLKFWNKGQGLSSVSDLYRKLDSFRVLFAYNSSKIENPEITYHDTREIFKNGMAVNFSGDPRALFEQQNQKLCYEFLAPKIVAKEPSTLDLIKEVHFLLTQGTYDKRQFLDNDERPGQFKKHDYVVGINEVGEPPEDIPALLQELLDEIHEPGGHVLKTAAYFHAKFEFYHPFADGNGRVGRTLLNYILMINNHPPLIIYNEDKKLYYEALEFYDKTENIESLFKFLEYESLKTWDKQLQQGKRNYDKDWD